MFFGLLCLAACSDSPDRLHPDLPAPLWSGRTVFYHTEWFECAAAVFALPEGQAARIRDGGIEALVAEGHDRRYGPWSPTPADDGDLRLKRWETNLRSGLSCLAGSPAHQALFSHLAAAPGGFYAVSKNEAVVIVAPAEGLVFYSGYK